jgi:hypothetical protein
MGSSAKADQPSLSELVESFGRAASYKLPSRGHLIPGKPPEHVTTCLPSQDLILL